MPFYRGFTRYYRFRGSYWSTGSRPVSKDNRVIGGMGLIRNNWPSRYINLSYLSRSFPTNTSACFSTTTTSLASSLYAGAGVRSTSETIAASIGSETAGDAAFASRSLNVSAPAYLSVPSALAVSAHDNYATLTSGGTWSISTFAFYSLPSPSI